MTAHTMDMPYRQGCAGQGDPGNHGKKKNEFREVGFKIDSSCLVVLEACFEQRQTFEQRVQKQQQQNHKLSSVPFMLNSGQKAEQEKDFRRISKAETESQLILKYPQKKECHYIMGCETG